MMTCIFARRAYSIEMCQSFIVEWLLNEGGGTTLAELDETMLHSL